MALSAVEFEVDGNSTHLAAPNPCGTVPTVPNRSQQSPPPSCGKMDHLVADAFKVADTVVTSSVACRAGPKLRCMSRWMSTGYVSCIRVGAPVGIV